MERAVPAWRSAAAEPAIVAALESLYADVASEIAARGPVCWASGRCCNFDRAGHRLYATGLETAYTLTRLAPAAPTTRQGLTVLGAEPAPRPLTAESLDEALARGGCPFQSSNLCSAHAMRPLGCRVYFCDRSAQSWQNEMYERAMGRLRSIHDEHGVDYLYGEWRGMLRMFLPPRP
jgi:Fe-S-cluster containining protein